MLEHRASAEDSCGNTQACATGPSLATAKSSETVSTKPLRARRSVHADYEALTAGAILLGVGYALALSVPLHRNFTGDSRHLAVPLVGPWLSSVTWPYALDGLLQLGGVTFIVDAYANPVAVLGASAAQLEQSRNREHLLSLHIRF
jgi:hypothetical protein